jgi:hypothetical protein
MKYVAVLPLLLVACGFEVNPLGHDEPNSSADEIATIGGHHLTDAAEELDGAEGSAVDAGAEEIDGGSTESTAGRGGFSDGGHIQAEDGGHLEPDAGEPSDARVPPDASEPSAEPDAAADAAQPTAEPDSGYYAPRSRSACEGCETQTDCTDGFSCVGQPGEGLCLPYVGQDESCDAICGGTMKLAGLTSMPATGVLVNLCRPDNGASSLSQACFNFIVDGHRCD